MVVYVKMKQITKIGLVGLTLNYQKLLKTTKLVGITLLTGCYGVHFPTTYPIETTKEIRIQENVFQQKAETTKTGDNSYVISYNPGWLNHHVEKDAQLFVFFHEVGHIELGHFGYLSKEQKRRAHIEADCYAGKMLRDVYHYTPNRFLGVYDMLENDHRSLVRKEALEECLYGDDRK